MLTLNMDYFRAKPVTIPKITILLDRGYPINFLIKKLEQIYPQIMTKIRFESSTKPSKEIRLCACDSQVGDGAVQESGQEL